MKLSQDNLIKLGLGAAGGYFVASHLLPHRGFAKQSCPSGKYCRGICCNHITNQHIQNASNQSPGDNPFTNGECANACGWTFDQADTYWRHATSDPHGAIIGEPYQEAVRASSSPSGIGSPLGLPGLDKIPIGWIVIGGLVLAAVVVLKR